MATNSLVVQQQSRFDIKRNLATLRESCILWGEFKYQEYLTKTVASMQGKNIEKFNQHSCDNNY